MRLLSWLLRRPPLPVDADTVAAFDTLLDRALTNGASQPMEYPLTLPRWQFLAHAAERRGLVLHGSGNPSIARFEPRKSDDVNDFGNQNAVYAASDGIWPIFFAILDRDRFPCGTINACLSIPGEVDPFYFFSISHAALDKRPWRNGTVYLLPGADFVHQPAVLVGDVPVTTGQVASTRPVVPLAKLPVGPEDFVFLGQVRGHDDLEMIARARANPTGFPWLEPNGADEST